MLIGRFYDGTCRCVKFSFRQPCWPMKGATKESVTEGVVLFAQAAAKAKDAVPKLDLGGSSDSAAKEAKAA